MLKPDQIAEIETLLAQGRSYRQINFITGVGKSSISKVASGQITSGRRNRNNRERQESLYRANTPQRCRQCGGLVYLPCRACGMRGGAKDG